MPIESHEPLEDSAQADGRRLVRYRFVDHLGKHHDRGPKKVPGDFDVDADRAAMASDIEAQLADNEYKEFATRFESGLNPMRDAQNNPIDPAHSTRTAIIRRLLRRFLSSPDPVKVMRATKALNNVTDAQMRSLLGINQTKVDAIRIKATQLADIAAAVDAYVPELNYD